MKGSFICFVASVILQTMPFSLAAPRNAVHRPANLDQREVQLDSMQRKLEELTAAQQQTIKHCVLPRNHGEHSTHHT